MIYELLADLHTESPSVRKRVIASSAVRSYPTKKKKVVLNKVNPDVANR